MASEPSATCVSCKGRLSPGPDRTCPRCGWDEMTGMRKCVKCRNGVVVLGNTVSFSVVGAMVGVGGFILWWFLGVFLSWGLVCAAGSICGLVSAVSIRHQCGMCRARAASSVLLPAERKEWRTERLGHLIEFAVLGLGAAVLFALFAASVRGR